MFQTYPTPCGWEMLTVSLIESYVDGLTLVSVEYGVGRMPGPSAGWKLTYEPTPRAVVAVSDGLVVSTSAK